MATQSSAPRPITNIFTIVENKNKKCRNMGNSFFESLIHIFNDNIHKSYRNNISRQQIILNMRKDIFHKIETEKRRDDEYQNFDKLGVVWPTKDVIGIAARFFGVNIIIIEYFDNKIITNVYKNGIYGHRVTGNGKLYGEFKHVSTNISDVKYRVKWEQDNLGIYLPTIEVNHIDNNYKILRNKPVFVDILYKFDVHKDENNLFTEINNEIYFYNKENEYGTVNKLSQMITVNNSDIYGIWENADIPEDIPGDTIFVYKNSAHIYNLLKFNNNESSKYSADNLKKLFGVRTNYDNIIKVISDKIMSSDTSR
jgi:hypothetical protein